MEQRKHTSSAGRPPTEKQPDPSKDAVQLGFDWALLPSGWQQNVVITVSDGVIAGLVTGVDASTRKNVVWTHSSVVPGMANVHSHAHQRLMAGLAERSGPRSDSFWTWREVMYSFVDKLSPEQLEAAAAQAYVEMLEAGFTAVGEFQYLHNQPDGCAYQERAELSLRCLEAARATGIAITLLPVLYCRGGFDDRALQGGQRRFASDVDGVLEMVSSLVEAVGRLEGKAEGKERVGVAPHSLRAVSEAELIELVRGVRSLHSNAPVHMHVAEQVAEVEDCLHTTGRRPVEWLLEQMATAGLEVDGSWCLIHATHLSPTECRDLAASQAVVGLCPTTEANLGDGVFSAREFLFAAQGEGAPGMEAGEAAGGQIAIGTDSQVRISVIEDLRQIETSQRLSYHQRNVLAGGPGRSTGRTLYGACARGGAQALNQPMGALEVGCRADLVVLNGDHERLMERTGDALLDSWIFAGDSGCVLDVYVGGERLVESGRHVRGRAVKERFRLAMKQLNL